MSSKSIAITSAAVAAQEIGEKLELAKMLRSGADPLVVRVGRIQGVNHNEDANLILQNEEGDWIADLMMGKAKRSSFYTSCLTVAVLTKDDVGPLSSYGFTNHSCRVARSFCRGCTRP
jgi:hypothetical protein